MAADPLEAASRLDSAPSGADSRLLALADQCVMCGLCLPHCPTYRISLDEAESPRGRIALARWIASGRLEPDPAALAHLDQCLDCLSCQKVCPSEVRYGEIIERARAMLPRPQGTVRRLLTDPARLVALARIGARVRADRWLPRLARWLPARLRSLAERVPAAPATKPMPRARVAPDRGRVTLFRGCVASVYDRDTHDAARVLLEALGYEVVMPEGTPCCGALARHAGDIDAANREVAAAGASIAATDGAAVLVSASGCFGDLRDHVSRAGGPPVVDVHAFLARDARIDALRFRALAARVALHLPCTQVNVVGEIASIRALLARIPALTVLTVPEQPRCCGAAGSYFIEHPAIADRLRDEKLAQIDADAPGVVLTTNVGCRIHLANGLRVHADAPPVMHPLALLARQLENGAP
ncbi:MAG TPA: (Fe-S)-binding protein [Rhodanobacteraceae bacterium]|nr:(Fe-S)-binding protein [Rhodanobacteraceae bacterium]